MAYISCPGNIAFFTCTWLDVHGKRGYHEEGVRHWHVPHVHISYILCIVTFTSKLALCMFYKRIIRSLYTEEVNRGSGMLEAGCFQWHVAGVLEVSQNKGTEMLHSDGREGVLSVGFTWNYFVSVGDLYHNF